MKIQNSKFKKLICFGFLIVILNISFLIFHSDKAEASDLSLNVEPPIIEINAIPPTNVTSLLKVQNKADTPITLQVQIKPFKARGENGELAYYKETPGIFRNIQILDGSAPVDSMTLNPEQQKTLTLNIDLSTASNNNVQMSTGGRDYYFSVVFTSTNFPPVESNSSINQVGIATNVLLSVGPKEIPKAAIEEFSSGLFFEKGPIPFTIRVKNTGNHLIKPEGEITIRNMFGQTVGKLNLSKVNILSDSIRAIPSQDSSEFEHPVVLWKESFLLGFYTAALNISMSDDGHVFARTIRFFAFPFLALIIIILIVVMAIMIINRLKKYMTPQ